MIARVLPSGSPDTEPPPLDPDEAAPAGVLVGGGRDALAQNRHRGQPAAQAAPVLAGAGVWGERDDTATHFVTSQPTL